MYSPTTIGLKYLAYYLRAANGKGHGIHSPFVFNFIKDVLNDRTKYPEYTAVEGLRRRLLADHTPVPTEDYGAGVAEAAASHSVAAIAARSSKSAKYGQLLFRIARYYQARYILELGTSLGISTAYLASANAESTIMSGEGNYVVAGKAKNNFDDLALHNIRIVTGNFDNTLPEMAGSLPHIDLAFIDGNHRKVPTIKYFHELLARKNESAIFIFDDIHWSAEMEAAWQIIRDHPASMLTVDLFFFGIVFFRPEFKVKQHFCVRF